MAQRCAPKEWLFQKFCGRKCNAWSAGPELERSRPGGGAAQPGRSHCWPAAKERKAAALMGFSILPVARKFDQLAVEVIAPDFVRGAWSQCTVSTKSMRTRSCSLVGKLVLVPECWAQSRAGFPLKMFTCNAWQYNAHFPFAQDYPHKSPFEPPRLRDEPIFCSRFAQMKTCSFSK